MAKFVTGRPKASPVWNYFDYDNSSNCSVCKVKTTEESENECGRSIKGKNPTNLKQHLSKNHTDCYKRLLEVEKEIKERKATGSTSTMQPSLSSMFNKASYGKESFKCKGVTRKLATFIGCANVATSLVESQEFRDLLHELDPRYVVPGRGAIRTELAKMLMSIKKNVSQDLENARKIHLCCDVWSKKGMSESFLGITAHFFAKHKRSKATLAVRHLDSPHTGKHILKVVKSVLREWNVRSDQIGKILTDNGSNMLKAFQDTIDISSDEDSDNGIESEVNITGGSIDDDNEENSLTDDQEEAYDVQKYSIEFDDCEEEHNQAFAYDDFQRLSCFSHTLQLIVAKFDEVKPCREAIYLSKKLVARFNKSVKATEKLVNLSGRKLIGDCPTRWSSTYLLLKRLIDLRPHVETVLSELEWDGLQI